MFKIPNHYKILQSIKDYIKKMPNIERYFEIALDHGLFAVEVMKKFPKLTVTLLDISKTSIQITSAVLNAFQIDASRFNFVNHDFLTAPVENEIFDFISMGEVLEHVNDAPGFLKRAYDLLHPQGSIFMSACANYPAIDHVYHFRNEDEIRIMIKDTGFFIVEESILLVEAVAFDGKYSDLIPSIIVLFLRKL